MNTKLKFYFFIIIIFLASNLNAQDNQKYSQVRINTGDISQIQKIADSGLLIDHAIRKPGFIEAWLSSEEIELLKKSGVSFSIIIPDWKTYYNNLPKMTQSDMMKAIEHSKAVDNVSHSIYGTMGGFLKYSEVAAKLDSMRLEYPNLISQKFFIDTTLQGRRIWTVRVSNSPNAPTGRPEVWYHSMIHAREPESMEHIIYYMYWLFENYNIDPIATYILQNRELYFTPVLNPDGYVYNETTNPNGGGMWRKNRRPNTGGSFGVDLNRNYGTFQFWNSSNGGSSTSASSDTYRGISPFSENETRGVMNFVNSRNIQAVLGSHTYGNYLIKPWAWQDPIPTPDDAKFNEYLADMTKYNHYTTGTPTQTVGYAVRGSADDWYYNDSAHFPHKIMAMTPETGATGFWPIQAEIIPLAQGMLYTNQYIAMLAGAFVNPASSTLNKDSYSAGESGTFKIKFKNKGIQTAQNVKIQCTSPSIYLNVPITFFNYSLLNSFQSDSSTFGFTISPAVPTNSALPLNITIRQNDSNIVHSETKYVLVGNGSLTLSDSAENGLNAWSTNQGWATTTTQSHSPSRSFTDSPSGSYVNNANNSLTLQLPVNVSSYPVMYLTFWHKYDTEEGYDFCNVDVSSNNGATWQTAASYNGTQSAWTEQILDITSYANSSTQVKVRFNLKSDAGVVADGWYVDDIELSNYNPVTGSVVSQFNVKVAPEGFYNVISNTLNMTDTVTLSLRNINPPYNQVEASIKTVDATSLTGNFQFVNTPTGTYYLQVRHRNSIETWSKMGGESFTFGGSMNFDFTTASSQAFGSNQKLKGSKYCVYSGDVNQDGIIDLTDLITTFNDANAFVTGYVVSDVSGDLVTDLSDVIIAYNNSANLIVKVTP